jgi:hypothetical protein
LAASFGGQAGKMQLAPQALEFRAAHHFDIFQAIPRRIISALLPPLGKCRWLHLRDPDGMMVEVYVDADPALWADRPGAVATVRPLRVDWLG